MVQEWREMKKVRRWWKREEGKKRGDRSRNVEEPEGSAMGERQCSTGKVKCRHRTKAVQTQGISSTA